jgi:hypothetical protein
MTQSEVYKGNIYAAEKGTYAICIAILKELTPV